MWHRVQLPPRQPHLDVQPTPALFVEGSWTVRGHPLASASVVVVGVSSAGENVDRQKSVPPHVHQVRVGRIMVGQDCFYARFALSFQFDYRGNSNKVQWNFLDNGIDVGNLTVTVGS